MSIRSPSAKLLASFLALGLCSTVLLGQGSPPPPALPTVNGSVTIATGNTFQTVLTSVPTNSNARRSLTIQNNNATSTCLSSNNCDLCYVFIGSGTPSKAKSIELSGTQAYTRFFPYVPSDTIQATCDNNSDTLYVDSQ